MFLSNKINKSLFILGPFLLATGWALLTANGSTASPTWALAHLLLLAALICVASSAAVLKELFIGRFPAWANDLILAATILGAVLLACQISLDLASWAAFSAAGTMGSFFSSLQSVALTRVLFYTAGPGLFFLGLFSYSLVLLTKRADLRHSALLISLASIEIVLSHLLNLPAFASLIVYTILLLGFLIITKRKF